MEISPQLVVRWKRNLSVPGCHVKQGSQVSPSVARNASRSPIPFLHLPPGHFSRAMLGHICSLQMTQSALIQTALLQWHTYSKGFQQPPDPEKSRDWLGAAAPPCVAEPTLWLQAGIAGSGDRQAARVQLLLSIAQFLSRAPGLVPPFGGFRKALLHTRHISPYQVMVFSQPERWLHRGAVQTATKFAKPVTRATWKCNSDMP